MHTKDRLAQALREVGLTVMADMAATGYYDDFLSPLDMPIVALGFDLAGAAKLDDPGRAKKILALRDRVMNGEFDATREEANAWAERGIPDEGL